MVSRRKGGIEPIPDPDEVMRRLQEIARSNPHLAADLEPAVLLISRHSAFAIDIYRTLLGSRLVEHLK